MCFKSPEKVVTLLASNAVFQELFTTAQQVFRQQEMDHQMQVVLSIFIMVNLLL